MDGLADRLPELALRTGEHVLLTGAATGAAIVAGVPLGILAHRAPALRGALLGGIGVLQTVPSLAMLAILLAAFGRIGLVPAITALVLYALLPIVRNTLAGLDGIAPEIGEAARGIGMTDAQQLRRVQLPLAMPVILAGVRTAAVAGVGIATLSAFIGAGGLGQFINRGLALSSTPLILLGAVPAAILALLVDGSIAAVGWSLVPARRRRRSGSASWLRMPARLAPAGVLALGVAAYVSAAPRAAAYHGEVRIGSKNFTEQILLGELMAQRIEAATELRVTRLFNLGGTMICHEALVRGEIDLYPEYTGTALTAVLGESPEPDAPRVLDRVRRAYGERFGCTWLAPFGFDNTYAVTVRREDATDRAWAAVSDLARSASSLRAGFTSEFLERPDGYPGLAKAYGLSFAELRDLEPSLMYQALDKGEVDVICAFATDGRIAAYGLQPLRDDRDFFPPYRAAAVVRNAVLEARPEVRTALEPLGGILTDQTMQRLNYAVDGEGRPPEDVAREFLEEKGLLPEAL